MNKLLFAIILLSYSCSSKSPKQVDEIRTGKLNVDERQKLISSQSNEIIFKLKNSDTNPLKIYKVQTSCTCTMVSEIENTVVEPNQVLDLTVTYNGPINKPVNQDILIYNSGKENPYVLSIAKD